MIKRRSLAGLLALVFMLSAFAMPVQAAEEAAFAERVFGQNRYETAVQASLELADKEIVILATGEDYADALSAGVLANAMDAQLLLTPKNALRDAVKERIDALAPKTVYLVGGPEALDPAIETALKDYTVERIEGLNRYETAQKLAAKNPNKGELFIATGEDYPDALVASSLTEQPLLLVRKNEVPSSVADFLKATQGDYTKITALGGEEALAQKVLDELKELTGASEVNRIFGQNRYETAANASEYAKDTKGVVIATGENFADALIAGPYAYEKGAVLLLSRFDGPSDYTAKYLESYLRLPLTLIGGPEALSDKAMETAQKHLHTAMHSLGSLDIGGETAAEIVSYNEKENALYIINGESQSLEIIPFAVKDGQITEPSRKTIDFKEQLTDFVIGDITSVASSPKGDYNAVALQAKGTNDAGRVVILKDQKIASEFATGAQPDMVTISPDGKWVITADEGEPREGYGPGLIDPKGTITVHNYETGVTKVLDFTAFDAKRGELLANKVLLKPGAAPSVDLEPEFVAVSGDSEKAYVSLQENNAIATVNLETLTIESVLGLGFKDHGLEENAIDILQDKKIGIVPQKGFYGIYNPDAIGWYEAEGKGYIVTANEGDAREWGDYENVEKIDVEGYEVEVYKEDAFEGLDVDKTYLLGGRSFAIFEADTMQLVYDSGSDMEEITAQAFPEYFNASHSNTKIDNRSDNKGPEPEGVLLFTEWGRTYAFIGLERIGGVMLYDITEPTHPYFIEYQNTRDFSEDVKGDSGPEGLAIIRSASDVGEAPVLLVSYEVSGTVGAFRIVGSKL